ncbi:MAG: hypothetical protein HN945_00675 [Deltaproteobacteria bacterium]|nr:hypothetical protein [Deltaproteobacteria bacterium]MBT7150946.1 hypothetical protein [Deltaproteobacteria bacterium]
MTEAEALINKIGKHTIQVMYYSPYAVGVAFYRLSILERSIQSNNRQATKELIKAAYLSTRIAVRYGRKFAINLTESFRLMAIYYWLINKQRKALKWFGKSIKEGERLGARPELSRTCAEVGSRLLEPGSSFNQLNGITAEEYLEKAGVLFQEMDLQRDLEQLEKVNAGREN